MSLNARTEPTTENATNVDARLPMVITAVIALLVYLLTLEPDLTWANFGGDGGELITAAVTLGIPHPPGYPTYVLLGKLFSYLPIGPIAFRFNLMSAVGTAVAAGLVTGIIFHFPAICSPAIYGRGINAPATKAVSGGLAFAFGSLVWGQAVIAEVYGLNVAFMAAFLYVVVKEQGGRSKGQEARGKWARGQGRNVGAGLLLGLAVTMHLTSFFLLPLALLLIPRRGWLWLGLGLVVGLLPFLLLPLLAQSGSPVIWGQPETVEQWWWLVSAQLYRPNVFGLAAADWPERLANWGRPFLAQFGYAGLLFVGLGVYGRYKKNGQLLAGLLATALIYIFYAFTYNTTDAAVLLIPALLLLSVVLGFGLDYLGKAAIVLPFALLWLNLGQSANGYYVNTFTDVRPAAEAILDDLPTNVIVLTVGDPTIAALWYFHHAEGKRPDITVIDGNLFQFDWYRAQLGQDYPFLVHLGQDDLAGFIQMNGEKRPICEVSFLTEVASCK